MVLTQVISLHAYIFDHRLVKERKYVCKVKNTRKEFACISLAEMFGKPIESYQLVVKFFLEFKVTGNKECFPDPLLDSRIARVPKATTFCLRATGRT